MASETELVRYIRFSLDTLGERNAHHEFEHLCLGLARRRIASNLLPATGPVSAGGDQGRDAESFWTQLPDEIPTVTTFVRLASRKSVVLACTIQRSDVPAKISSDLVSICSRGEPVDRVVYFTVAAVPVGKRHDLQQVARGLGVGLDIWDGLGIAHELAEPDLYHLAVAHLQTPAEMAPAPPDSDKELPDWYLEARARWRERVEVHGTSGELVDLRAPLRHATFSDVARADVAEWIGHAHRMLAATAPDDPVRSLLHYEIAVATLRGTGTLQPTDHLVRAFFSAALPSTRDLGLLRDCSVLHTYAHGAWRRHLTDITVEELAGWQRGLSDRVTTLLAEDPPPNRTAELHALAARIAFHGRLDPTGRPARSEHQAIVEVLEDNPDVSGHQLVDVDAGMSALAKLCDLLPSAPLFPVDDTAELFSFLAPLLTRHPHYRRINRALNEAAALAPGGIGKAKLSRQRAVQLLRAEDLLGALDEIHSMKMSLWSGDTLEDSLQTMLFAAQTYAQLNLHLAAKQHALTAATVAQSTGRSDVSEFIARGILRAAEYDFLAGSWLSSATLAQVGVRAQAMFADDPWNLELHTEFAAMVAVQCRALEVARASRPDLAPYLEHLHASTDLDTLLEPILSELPAAGTQAPHSFSDWAQIASDHGMGTPFSDSGPIRTYRWRAYGTTWTVSADNQRDHVLAAERFAAAAQIAIVELGRLDPLLLPCEIKIRVHLVENGSTMSENADGWSVGLSPTDPNEPHEHQVELFNVVVQILLAHSLLPQDAFMRLVHDAFAEGLWHKVLMGRPYDELLGMLPATAFERIVDLPAVDTQAHAPAEHTLLAAHSSTGPLDNADQLTVMVRNRYERLPQVLRYTLPRLAGDLGFRKVVASLREKGWLDWHIMAALAVDVVNERVRHEGVPVPPRTEADARRATAVMFRAEAVEDPRLPASMFTGERLTTALTISAMHTVRNLGLELRQRRPDSGSVLDFLATRYAYWSLDVPHNDPFSGPTEPSEVL